MGRAGDDGEVLARRFGRRAARAKIRWIEAQRGSPRSLRRAAGALSFMCAWPDTREVRASAERALGELESAETLYEYSYGVVRQLLASDPRCIEIDWDELPDEGPVVALLEAVLHPGEARFLEDSQLELTDWFEVATKRSGLSDLQLLVTALEATGLPESVKVELFERCEFPIWHRGRASQSLLLEGRRIHYQKADIDRRTRFPLAPIIRRPALASRRAGRSLVEHALAVLCPRSLEIYPLIYANPRDAAVIECSGGLAVGLIGVEPRWRAPLETLAFFMIFKNGVPLGYGPAAAAFGCCEMGINLFPEFRGGDIRMIYAQLMRALHHHLHVDYFWIARYGMGEDNEEAIETGAFWFYRKLGFVPTEAKIEALAREQEALRAADPSHRSSRRVLRSLSHTEVFFDLSGGRRRPLPVGRLALRIADFVAGHFGADRARATNVLARRAARRFDLDASMPSLRRLAPLLAMLPEADTWPSADRRRLRRLIIAKNAPSETGAARLMAKSDRLAAALQAIVEGADRGSRA